MPGKQHGTGNEDRFKWALSFQWRHKAKLLAAAMKRCAMRSGAERNDVRLYDFFI